MEEKEREPQYYADIIAATLERTIHRLWILLIVLVLLLFGSNAAWIAYEAQFTDEVTETVETTTDGGGNAYGAIVSGNNSEVRYGESQSNSD